MKFLESQEPTKRRKPVMKIKKLFALALTAALTISLAACSGGASATKMTMGTGAALPVPIMATAVCWANTLRIRPASM